MPSYIHEFIDEHDTIFHFLIEFKITSYGAPATWWDPAENAEFEIEEVYQLTHVLLHEVTTFTKLRQEDRPYLYREYMGRGLTSSINYYFFGDELTPHQYEFFQLVMKTTFEEIIDEHWDPEWLDRDDFCD